MACVPSHCVPIPKGCLAPVLAWNLDTFKLEDTANRRCRHGLPMARAGNMSESPDRTLRVPCSSPLLCHTGHLCTAPEEHRLCQRPARTGRRGVPSELWAKSGEKPGLKVGGRGPEVECLGFLSLLIFLSWPSKKAVAPPCCLPAPSTHNTAPGHSLPGK